MRPLSVVIRSADARARAFTASASARSGQPPARLRASSTNVARSPAEPHKSLADPIPAEKPLFRKTCGSRKVARSGLPSLVAQPGAVGRARSAESARSFEETFHVCASRERSSEAGEAHGPSLAEGELKDRLADALREAELGGQHLCGHELDGAARPNHQAGWRQGPLCPSPPRRPKRGRSWHRQGPGCCPELDTTANRARRFQQRRADIHRRRFKYRA